jgi:ribosomal protein S27AE
MSTTGSPLDFLVRYAEAEGGLAERVAEGALLVLPEAVRAALDLPEAIGLTEDPETAREEEFLLFTAGHPALMAAAGAVLARGDVGCSSVPRPAGLPPTPSALEAKAREQIHADHGRIDVRATPDASHVGVLQTGALLTYSISIDERVQELAEVWVMADSGRAAPPELCERLRTAALEAGVQAGITAPAPESVAHAHDLITTGARRRIDELTRQTAVRLQTQLEVVDDYYARLLSSIDERLSRAGADRIALLEEQSGATHREWARRRAEVADDLTPTFEVQPFRLHMVAVPSYSVRAAVRRGALLYPLRLDYVPILSSFLQPPCPSCGAVTILVAGKDRLGCRSCMPPAPPTASPGRATSAKVRADGPRKEPNERLPSPISTPSARPVRTAATPGSPRAAPVKGARHPRRPTGRVTPKGSTARATTAQTGSRIAVAFWSSVDSGELRARDAVPNSPMRSLLRLYGPRGPAYVVGLGESERMVGVATSPVDVDADGTSTIEGDLKCAGAADVTFALSWRPGSRSNLLEVQGYPLDDLAPLLARRDEYGKLWRQRYRQFLVAPPEPVIGLDPTSALLLDRSARLAGLAYAMRCIAAWEYATERDEAWSASTDRLDPPMAAAIESVVSKRLGMRMTIPALAERYGCPADRVRSHVKALQYIVRDRPDLRW